MRSTPCRGHERRRETGDLRQAACRGGEDARRGRRLSGLSQKSALGGFQMAISDFQSLMLPVLQRSATGEAQIGDVVEKLADKFNLTDEERSTLLPSGRQTTFANRVHWAKNYLGKAGLVELTGRGRFRITKDGERVLSAPPKRIDIKFLEKFPQFRNFRQATTTDLDLTQ